MKGSWERGSAHLLVILAAVGIMVYLLVSSVFPFKDKLFSLLYPKPASQAAGFSVGFNISGITHYGYNDILPYAPASDIDANLSEVQRMRGTVVRVFAANKYIGADEAARRLDAFLTKAEVKNIPVIISFIDFYKTGYNPQGTDQYYTDPWNGTVLLGDQFFASGYKNEYLSFVKTVVNYNKYHSNIYAWEPGNELKDGFSPPNFINFMKDVTSVIKNLDPTHSVATGMISAAHTGLTPDQLYSSLPAVDIITVHVYNGSRFGAEDIDWATSHNKQSLIEEIGYSGTGDRSGNMNTELSFWKSKGAGGVLQWGLIAKGLGDNGNGDKDVGMDSIWHTDYDALAGVFQNYATTSTPSCDSSQVMMSVSPNPSQAGEAVTFNVSGNQGSTYIDDKWTGGVDCAGGFWGSKTCTTTSGGNFIWTHLWKNCAPNNCSVTSIQCSKSFNFEVSGGTLTSTPTIVISPTPTVTLYPSPSVLTPTPNFDSIPPSVNITKPLNGARISKGKVTNISASASDNIGITKVDFYVGSIVVCTDLLAPYSCSWQVPSASRVSYTLTAKAYDQAGNTSISSVNVTSK